MFNPKKFCFKTFENMAGIPLHSLQREEEVQIYNEEGTLFFQAQEKE